MKNSQEDVVVTFTIDEYPEPVGSPLFRQILAACASILITITGAVVSGYSAVLLPQLTSHGSDIEVDLQQQSWIASMSPLTMAFGCFFGGWCMEKIGRRSANILAAAIMVVGWLFIYFATNLTYLLVGRAILGFAIGINVPGAVCYLGEVSHPKYRGLFLSGIAFGVAFGIFLAHLIGTFVTWRTLALITILLSPVCIGLFLYVPESHVWYVKKNRIHEAKKAFVWFRGKDGDSMDELLKILADKEVDRPDLKTLFKEMLTRRFILPLVILNIYFVTCQLTGNSAVTFYTVDIMGKAVNFDRYTSMLIVDVFRVVLAVAASVLIKRHPVRLLTMISGIGTTISLFFIAATVVLQKNTDNHLLNLLPLVGFVLYITFAGVGLLSLPWIIGGELFPPTTKGVGGGISMFVNFFLYFLVVKSGPTLMEEFGVPLLFAGYGTAVLIGTVLLYYTLPETRNKTLKEIEQFFTSKYLFRRKTVR